LIAAIRARFGRPGVGQLRTIQQLTRAGALCPAEQVLHALLCRASITGWVANVEVSDAAGRIGVVDLLFPGRELVIEVDGERYHAGRRAFVADRRRQNRLVNAGFRVLRFTWWDLEARPDDVVPEVLQALKICAG